MRWLPWALLSAVFAAATAILAKIGVENIDSNYATAIRTTAVAVLGWLIVCLTRPPGGFATPGRRSLLFLLLSGLATGLSWICYFRALQLGPASRVAPIDKLSVALVIVFAAAVLGEKLTPAKAFGGLLITAGAIVVALD